MLKKRDILSKFVLTIFLICILILPFQLSCESFEERIEDIGYRTVQIVFVQTDGEETIGMTSIGTGFILNNEGYVITSSDIIYTGEQYVLDDVSGKMAAVIPAPAIAAGNQYSGFASTNDFGVVAIDDEHNLALLKVEFASVISPGSGNRISSVHYHNHVNGTLEVGTADFTGSASEGSTIAVTGFSSDEFFTETVFGKITSKKASGVYATNIASDPGLSGSPVYSADTGKIIGICICSGSEDMVIVPASCIKNLLKSN
jgi:V8-like Glu-specific endopeptidase